MSSSIDDIAAKLPNIEFTHKKKPNEYYNQKMQSLRGARQFMLRTYIDQKVDAVRLTLIEYGEGIDQEVFIASRKAEKDNPETFIKALKSLERAAQCRLYYVLLISTDGEYL